MTTLMTHRKLNRMCSFIQDYTARRGFSPSLREIAAGCGLSLNAVSRYLGQLEAQGRVTRIPGQARSVRVVGAAADTLPSQPGGPPGQPPAWCVGCLCPLLAARLALLCEAILEKGAAS